MYRRARLWCAARGHEVTPHRNTRQGVHHEHPESPGRVQPPQRVQVRLTGPCHVQGFPSIRVVPPSAPCLKKNASQPVGGVSQRGSYVSPLQRALRSTVASAPCGPLALTGLRKAVRARPPASPCAPPRPRGHRRSSFFAFPPLLRSRGPNHSAFPWSGPPPCPSWFITPFASSLRLRGSRSPFSCLSRFFRAFRAPPSCSYPAVTRSRPSHRTLTTWP